MLMPFKRLKQALTLFRKLDHQFCLDVNLAPVEIMVDLHIGMTHLFNYFLFFIKLTLFSFFYMQIRIDTACLNQLKSSNASGSSLNSLQRTCNYLLRLLARNFISMPCLNMSRGLSLRLILQRLACHYSFIFCLLKLIKYLSRCFTFLQCECMPPSSLVKVL